MARAMAMEEEEEEKEEEEGEKEKEKSRCAHNPYGSSQRTPFEKGINLAL